VRALSRLFRGKFLHGARQLLPREQRPAYSDREWVVYAKPTLNRTRKVLTYLGRYVHRVAITNRRILKMEKGHVTFCWQESATGASRRMTLPAEEFLRRFLQHVLPKGTHKVGSTACSARPGESGSSGCSCCSPSGAKNESPQMPPPRHRPSLPVPAAPPGH
jgi:hypothetical protein